MAGRPIDRFFEGRAEAKALFRAVEEAIRRTGPASMKVTRSQVAFSRRRGFAWAWTPDRALKRTEGLAPLVLSIALGRHDPSRRWKQVVEPARGRWMHHLELRDPAELDGEVLAWLKEAWDQAG